MARNEEKSQSMLYRFREAKAVEMGMINRSDRRPRMASMCTNLAQAERWRGEILREISRKVAKIQDNSLTDYEVRDLNDEINKLLREKYHWENQIVNLGGANYRRAAPKIVLDDGTTVPGMRGYKYFGRARELPGVKELLAQNEAEAREQAALKVEKISIFSNQPPAYYGNEADQDQALLDFEKKAEAEAWEDQWANVESILDLPEDAEVPPCPQPTWISLTDDPSEDLETDETAATGAKRKVAENGTDEANKRSKNSSEASARGPKIFTVLDKEDLRPRIPTAAQIEKAILERQKAELLSEYVGS